MKAVTITANDDGSFQVELEPANEGMEAPEKNEGQEMGSADMAEDKAEGEQSVNCASIDEALDAAKQMFGMDNEAAEPQMDGEAEFTKGFKQVRGTPDEQMAARMGR